MSEWGCLYCTVGVALTHVRMGLPVLYCRCGPDPCQNGVACVVGVALTHVRMGLPVLYCRCGPDPCQNGVACIVHMYM